MAKRTLLECDGCGATAKVVTVQGKRGNTPFSADLCEECWTQMAEDYGIQVGSRARRKDFVVYADVSDIPR